MRDRQLIAALPTATSSNDSPLMGANLFLAVDVETANTDPSSICQIAIVRFERGTAVNIWQSMINPGEQFAALNVSLHGIDEVAVANAPEFPQVIGVLSELLSGKVVATHMAFDRIALQSALTKHCVESVECSWLDTASVARRAWPRFAKRGYGLKSLSAWCGIDLRHHDAVEDATAAGLIFAKAMADTGTTVGDWMARLSPTKSRETRGKRAERNH